MALVPGLVIGQLVKVEIKKEKETRHKMDKEFSKYLKQWETMKVGCPRENVLFFYVAARENKYCRHRFVLSSQHIFVTWLPTANSRS